MRTVIEAQPQGPTTGSSGSREEHDPAFLRGLKAREREALGRFHDLFFDRIHAYVRRLVGDDHLAEDVTQDVFMHLHRSIDTYDPARELAPWVFTIATNKVRDHWRSRRHQDGLREVALDADEDGAGFEPVDGRPGPLPDLEADELRGALEAAIAELPTGLREVLVLRWHEDMPFDRIGDAIGRNEVAARKRYSRALAALRSALEKHVDDRREARS